jgi:hypothetical protein
MLAIWRSVSASLPWRARPASIPVTNPIATVACVRPPVMTEGGGGKIASFSESTAAAYHLGGICTIVVGDGNGEGGEAS